MSNRLEKTTRSTITYILTEVKENFYEKPLRAVQM